MNTLDRDKARAVLRTGWLDSDNFYNVDALLDRLEACVMPAPAPTIDRDAVAAVLGVPADKVRTAISPEEAMTEIANLCQTRMANPVDARFQAHVWPSEILSILALVQPAPGITITPDEAALAAMWMRALDQAGAVWGPNSHALAAKLEAAS